MTNIEVDRCLQSMIILCDTREQPTRRFKNRMETTGLPYERRKLDVGDYSCGCILPDGKELDFSDRAVIERKMNIEEICMCFGKERKRFRNEFERAKASGTKVYLLIEDGSWEKIYNWKYKSRFNPVALIASIDAYRVRYGMQLDFCKAETTGKIIKDILYRELKEYLEGIEDGGKQEQGQQLD